MGHCVGCHTPRNIAGGLKCGKHLAGTRYGPDGHSVPNITPDSETGIGSWSEVDLVFFFKTGLKPDGDDVQGHMREAIEDGLSHMTPEDLAAIAAYLKTQRAIRHPVRGQARDGCHQLRRMVARAAVPLFDALLPPARMV